MKLDWNLLRAQKLCLLEITDVSSNPGHILAIAGILSVLDAIQDEAVENGDATEDEVFGETIDCKDTK